MKLNRKKQKQFTRAASKRDFLKYKRFAIGFGLIGFLLPGWFFLDTKMQGVLSNFGQYVGGVTAASWSLAGILVIYVALQAQKIQISLQAKDLELNREELKLTRQELAGQREQFELQNQQLRHQGFETTFFNLLANYRAVIQTVNIQTDYTRGPQYGVLAIQIIADRIERNLTDFTEIWPQYQTVLANLYEVINFVHSNTNPFFKTRYYDIIKAQLTLYDEALIKSFLSSRFHPPYRQDLRDLLKQKKIIELP